jgi:hypothetical protein
MMGGHGHHGGQGQAQGGNQQVEQNEQYPQQQFIENPPQNQSLMQDNFNKCFNFSNIFNECMKFNMNNSKVCEQAFDDLKNCQNNI